MRPFVHALDLVTASPGEGPRTQPPSFSEGVDIGAWIEREAHLFVEITLAAGFLAYFGCLAVVAFHTRWPSTPRPKVARAVAYQALGLVVLAAILGCYVWSRFAILNNMDGFYLGLTNMLLTVAAVPMIGLAYVVEMRAHRLLTLRGTRTANSARRESRPVAFATTVPVAIALFLPPVAFAVAIAAAPFWILFTFKAVERVRRVLPCRMPETVCLGDCISLQRGDTCPKGFGSGGAAAR